MLKCPNCQKTISYLDPAIMGAPKPEGRKCPYCGERYSITADYMLAGITIVVVTILGFLVLVPIPMIGGALWGVSTLIAVYLIAVRLEKYKPKS